ncbi:MAG: hypothetical protein M0R30_00760 [Methanoregula sp.]|uniref:hypothetical protein n=1 Tax=Methanoregula sp. TaxID=2052170 RepID=UPI0025DA3BCB|nr:hypothetical protein [Methanoregula sp.]MCK9630148.1 hypothetical protein [Methanoregula sp.]
MPSDPHVHIITAGENIQTAYPAIFRTLPTITRTYVFADSDAYTLSSNPEREKQRLAIMHSVDAVKELSATLSIPFSRELVFPPVYPSARDLLERIVQDNPGARFTMDLSAGSRSLCTALATLAPWIDAGVYSSFDEKVPRAVPAPGMQALALLANPNYQTILALLLRKYEKHVPDGTREWVSREYLYKQVWGVYRRTRARTVKPDSRPVVYRRGFRSPQELSHGTFSSFMKALIGAGLVEQRMSSGESIRKEYRGTESGEMAFRFYANADTSTLVRTMLGKKKGFQLVSARPHPA